MLTMKPKAVKETEVMDEKWKKRILIKWMIGVAAIIISFIVDNDTTSDRSIMSTFERMGNNPVFAISMMTSLIISILLVVDVVLYIMYRIRRVRVEFGDESEV